MGGPMSRRELLAATAAAGAAAMIPRPLRAMHEVMHEAMHEVMHEALLRAAQAPGAPSIIAKPFDLSAVRLLPGVFFDATEVNRRQLLALDPDRLLHMFRITAGIPSTAQPLGGWEAPVNELRGHYTGHFMSACALMGTSMREPELRKRGAYVASVLAQCQQAHGNGYVSAFPEEFFDRLREGKPVWAPFYTLHKIMAGLLDQHTLAGNAQALDVVTGMAGIGAEGAPVAWVAHIGGFVAGLALYPLLVRREFRGR